MVDEGILWFDLKKVVSRDLNQALGSDIFVEVIVRRSRKPHPIIDREPQYCALLGICKSHVF